MRGSAFHLPSLITKEPFCPMIPAANPAIGIEQDDAVVLSSLREKVQKLEMHLGG
jgi:hypothetical protein